MATRNWPAKRHLPAPQSYVGGDSVYPAGGRRLPAGFVLRAGDALLQRNLDEVTAKVGQSYHAYRKRIRIPLQRIDRYRSVGEERNEIREHHTGKFYRL